MDSLLTKEFVWLIVLRVIREIEREILTNIMGHDHISKDLNEKECKEEKKYAENVLPLPTHNSKCYTYYCLVFKLKQK